MKSVVLMLALLGAWLIVSPAAKSSPEDLFSSAKIPSFRIDLSTDAIASLADQPKKPVSAIVSVEGRVYTNVTLHLKGLGSFQPVTEKPSFSVKFNGSREESHWARQSRILLENSSQDDTFLCRRLCSEIFLRAGIPAARVTWATVRLNDRNLGFYTLSEAMDKQFLRRHFKSPDGSLYEGSDEDVDGPLQQDSGVPVPERADLRALIATCEEPDPGERWRRLAGVLDVDRFIVYAALEVLVCHHDGYSLDLNNYRLYRDPKCHQFVFIPHGMDLVFDRPQLRLEPEWKGLVARAVLTTPEGARRYRERVHQLAEEVYGKERLTERIDELAAALTPTVRLQGQDATLQFHGAVAELKARIRERARFVLGSGTKN